MNAKGLKPMLMLLAVMLIVACGSDSPPAREGTGDAVVAGRRYAVETADGTTIASASLEQVLEGIESLDEDNFFLILSHEGGFVQTAYSDGEYYVEYNEEGEQFAGTELLSLEDVTELFSLYYRGEEGWMDIVEWGPH